MNKKWQDNILKNINDIKLNRKLNRRDFTKILIGIGAAIGIGYYSYKLLSKQMPRYEIYLEDGIAKALNVKKGSIDYQGYDHHSVIQNALNNIPPRQNKEKVNLKGDFISSSTIEIPSFTVFELEGGITLDNNVDKILIQEQSPIIGTSSIEMIGGTYDGNKNNQSITNPVMNFTKVINSRFANLIVQNSGKDCFSLDTDCNNNIIENVIGKRAGLGTVSDGNGLVDRGDHNIWIDCIAENNFSDNWVIKCRNSKFINCIGRESIDAVGFGLFADRDITGNQFAACKAYDNKTNGMSLNIPNKSEGKSIRIENNSIQGEFYDNGTNGIRFVDVTTDGSCRNNIVDILTYNNKEKGFYIHQDGIDNNSGTIVTYDNKVYDVDIRGKSNIFNIYTPKGKAKINVDTDNSVTYIDCGYRNSWAVNKYCKNK